MTRTTPSDFGPQTSSLLKILFRVAYARNLRGNLHVKSKDLNGPELYI